MLYRVLFVLAIPLGAMANLGFIWLMADTFNAMMAIPNLIALALLSPVVFKLTRDYFDGKEILPGEELDHDKGRQRLASTAANGAAPLRWPPLLVASCV